MGQLRFNGRVALITGSSRGLGLEYARLLASRGAHVVLNSRTPDALAFAADLIRTAGGSVAVAPGDLSTEEGCRYVVAQALEAFGRVDILINNAGVSRRKAFADVSTTDYRELLALNLDSTFFTIHALWPHMIAQGYGRIVNTASGAGLFGTSNHALYGMAKAAVCGLTRVLAVDAAQTGICINAVTPLAATRLANNIQDDVLRQEFFETLPADRCAPAVCWLSHESCDVNGEVLDIGGGAVSRIFTALTPGYLNPRMTIEDVASHRGEIFAERGYVVPTHGEARAGNIIERIRAWTKIHEI